MKGEKRDRQTVMSTSWKVENKEKRRGKKEKKIIN